MPKLVVSPPYDPEEWHGPDTLDEQELRYWLLFWDKLEHPANSAVRVEDRTTDFLYETSILQRTAITNYRLLEGAAVYIQPIIDAYEHYDAQEPGTWALALGNGALTLPATSVEFGRGYMVRLLRSIPVPNVDVPLADVLEFASRRGDEKAALLEAIEDVYQGALSAPDRPLAENSGLARVARAARDQLRITQEARFGFRLVDVEARFNLMSGIQAAAASMMFGAGLAHIVGNSLIAGAQIDVGRTFGFAKKEIGRTPYAYVSSFHRELFPPGWEG